MTVKRIIALTLVLALALGLGLLARAEGQVETVLDTEVNGLRVRAARQYGEEKETLRVACYSGIGDELWSREISAKSSQGYSTDAFIGGTSNAPLLMAYAASKGLIAVDMETGKPEWTLSTGKVDLGESISHAVTEDGTMVIGGYLAPDPVAIDINGSVLWQSNVGSDDIFWLDGIKLDSKGVAAHYDHLMGEGSGWVLFGWDGKRLNIKKD